MSRSGTATSSAGSNSSSGFNHDELDRTIESVLAAASRVTLAPQGFTHPNWNTSGEQQQQQQQQQRTQSPPQPPTATTGGQKLNASSQVTPRSPMMSNRSTNSQRARAQTSVGPQRQPNPNKYHADDDVEGITQGILDTRYPNSSSIQASSAQDPNYYNNNNNNNPPYGNAQAHFDQQQHPHQQQQHQQQQQYDPNNNNNNNTNLSGTQQGQSPAPSKPLSQSQQQQQQQQQQGGGGISKQDHHQQQQQNQQQHASSSSQRRGKTSPRAQREHDSYSPVSWRDVHPKSWKPVRKSYDEFRAVDPGWEPAKDTEVKTNNDFVIHRMELWQYKKQNEKLEAEWERLQHEVEGCTFQPDLDEARRHIDVSKLLSPSSLYADNHAWGFDSFVRRQEVAREKKAEKDFFDAQAFKVRGPAAQRYRSGARMTVQEPFEFASNNNKRLEHHLMTCGRTNVGGKPGGPFLQASRRGQDVAPHQGIRSVVVDEAAEVAHNRSRTEQGPTVPSGAFSRQGAWKDIAESSN